LKFFSDWRNIALIVAVLLIGALLVVLLPGGKSSIASKRVIVRINDRHITEDDIVSKLKKQYGDQLVSTLVGKDLIECYAEQKKVTVSDAEIDQVIDFEKLQMEARGQDLMKQLEAKGITMPEIREQLKPMILQIKLVVPDEKIKAQLAKIVKEPHDPFAYPARYSVRQFLFLNKESAAKALALFRKGGKDNELKATSMAINNDPTKPITMFLGTEQPPDPALRAALKATKVNAYTDILPTPQAASGVMRILQVVTMTPEEQPTMTNRNILIGQYLMQSNQEYQMKARDLEAEALQKVDVQFYSPDEYKQAVERFKRAQKQNPLIQGGSQMAPRLPLATPTPPPASPGPR